MSRLAAFTVMIILVVSVAVSGKVKNTVIDQLPDGLTATKSVGGTGGGPFAQIDSESAPVIGFRYQMGDWAGKPCVRTVLPLFEKPTERGSTVFGPLTDQTAKQGYVVGGIRAVGDQTNLVAFQIVFMAYKDGKVVPTDAYLSSWIGNSRGLPVRDMASNGQKVVGIFGRHGLNMDALGLIVSGEAGKVILPEGIKVMPAAPAEQPAKSPSPAANAPVAVPPMPTPLPRRVTAPSDRQAAMTGDSHFKKTNWDDVHSADLQDFSNPPAGWTAPPDGSPRHDARTVIPLHGSGGIKPSMIRIARRASRAFVSYPDAGDPPALAIEVVDLARGKSFGPYAVDADAVIADVSPDGLSVLIANNSDHTRLEIWKVDSLGNSVEKSLVFSPFPGDERASEVKTALFTDASHIVAMNAADKVAMFDIGTVSAVWSAKIEGGYGIHLSPGGKYLLVRTRDAQYNYREPTLLSAETGKPIGMLSPGAVADDPPLSFHSVVAFSPSGKHIAMIDDHNVRVWDLVAGKPSDLFGLPVGNKIWGRPAMAFTSETNAVLAIDGEMLLDLQRRIPLWQYTVPAESTSTVAMDGRFWYAMHDPQSDKFVLLGVELPDDQAAAVAKKLDPDSLLLLHPGAKVSVKVELPGTDDRQARIIKDQIVEKLKAIKVDVVDGQDLMVKAVIEVGPKQDAFYVRRGRPEREGEIVHYTVKQSKVILQLGGDVAWQSFRWYQPGNQIRLFPGESIQDAVIRVSKPDYDFFSSAEIPEHIARPHDPMCFGASVLAPAN